MLYLSDEKIRMTGPRRLKLSTGTACASAISHRLVSTNGGNIIAIEMLCPQAICIDASCQGA